MSEKQSYRKKLIEVALPLEAINNASAYDKMPGIGPHPKGLHHWWARLPLPCARSILFASLVNDPVDDDEFSDKSESIQNAERERLFGIMESLLQKKIWENPVCLELRARKHIPEKCYDCPTLNVCGGGCPLNTGQEPYVCGIASA